MTSITSDAVSRALEAARRAAEEALRRAQEAAAQQADQEAQAAAANATTTAASNPSGSSGVLVAQDGLDTSPSYGVFSEGSSTATATTATGPTYSPDQLMNGETTATDLAPPLVEPEPPDPITQEEADHLVDSFEAAAAAWESLPPDLQLVAVDTAADPSAIVDDWIAAGETGIGPGDPEAFESYMRRNRDGMEQLAVVLGEPTPVALGEGIGQDLDTEVNRFTTPAVMALAEQYPDATFQVMVLESSALPERMAGTWGSYDSQIVIEMNDGGEIRHFALNPSPLYEMSGGGAGPIYETLAADPQLLETWYESVVEAQPGYDQGSAMATLELLTSPGSEPVAVQSVLAMPPEAQAQFLLSYGEVEPSAGERPFGILNPIDHVSAENVVVAVDATAMANGAAPASIDSLVNLAAVDNLDKTENFISENYDTVVAPLFDQFRIVRGDEPRVLEGTALINEVGAAMNLPPNNIPQTEEEMALFEAGEWPFYTGETLDAITTVANNSEELASPPAEVTALPITFRSEELASCSHRWKCATSPSAC